MFGTRTTFDKAVEKATSQLLLEPDWDSILQISDCIRQGDVLPKYALTSIKRKIGSDNPHVSLFALQVLESSVKNCGSLIHAEIATKDFMEYLKNLVTTRGDPVKAKILELVQFWSHAFRNEPNYKVVQDTFTLMKLEGYQFPTLKESDAMFLSEKAPDWKDADCCTRCRVAFGMMQRKHHCRACGEIFCGKCSGKTSIIPKFGIEKEVRVCDSCYDKLNTGSATQKSEDDLPAEYLSSPLAKQSQTPVQKTEQEIQEEEELQLAMALSKSEEESKTKERDRMRNNYGMYGSQKETQQSPPPSQSAPVSAPMVDTADMDPELARYLNRNYWQQRSTETKVTPSTTQPSAPTAVSEAKTSTGAPIKVQETYQNGETDEDPDQFLNALNSSVEILVNRMRSDSQRGRSIATDSSVQSLFNVISNMHPQLMKYTQDQEDLRAHFESLQDKLAQLRDAREALDALREDHREKRRLEMEELERQRQIQMAQKLDIMRQKKHEYLEMQRQLALQRLQEQEREMYMRLEQQKQLTQIRQMQTYGYGQPQYPPGPMAGQMPPGPQVQGHMLAGQGPMVGAPGSMHGMPQGYNPAGSMEGSPVHQLNQGHPQGGYMGQQIPAGQSMYGQPIGQPGYSQPAGQQGGGSGGGGYQGVPPQQGYINQSDGLQGPSQAPPGGYSMTDGSMPTQGGVYPPAPPQGSIGYNPATGPQSLPQNPPASALPSHVAQNNQGYSSLPPDYNQTYNMQGMANSLPQTDSGIQQYNPPPQQQYNMGGGQYQQQGQGQTQPQGQAPPISQGPMEAELISFD